MWTCRHPSTEAIPGKAREIWLIRWRSRHPRESTKRFMHRLKTRRAISNITQVHTTDHTPARPHAFMKACGRANRHSAYFMPGYPGSWRHQPGLECRLSAEDFPSPKPAGTWTCILACMPSLRRFRLPALRDGRATARCTVHTGFAQVSSHVPSQPVSQAVLFWWGEGTLLRSHLATSGQCRHCDAPHPPPPLAACMLPTGGPQPVSDGAANPYITWMQGARHTLLSTPTRAGNGSHENIELYGRHAGADHAHRLSGCL